MTLPMACGRVEHDGVGSRNCGRGLLHTMAAEARQAAIDFPSV